MTLRHSGLRNAPRRKNRPLWFAVLGLALVFYAKSQLENLSTDDPPIQTSPSSVTLKEFTGKVRRVIDGDTITVDRRGHVERVRLWGIDAPEYDQPYGELSRNFLRNKLQDQTVTVRWNKRDKFGRVLGTIQLKGENVNQELVRAGLAWHYPFFKNEQPRSMRESFARAQTFAQEAKQGLWASSRAIPPWEHKRAQ